MSNVPIIKILKLTSTHLLYFQGSSLGKRYKYVVTGHGKYEKIPTDGDHYSVYPNEKSSETLSMPRYMYETFCRLQVR